MSGMFQVVLCSSTAVALVHIKNGCRFDFACLPNGPLELQGIRSTKRGVGTFCCEEVFVTEQAKRFARQVWLRHRAEITAAAGN
ncbi:MAG: hypothetical protein IT557_07870 [Alphaproteobacteria bacterium]|nr:hypothetical protein [Alphaproteobacteria bacterium]